MRDYYERVVDKKKYDFMNTILPTLVNSGWNSQYLQNMFHSGQIRLRWGRNWNEFTALVTNPLNLPIGTINKLIHKVWDGIYVENCMVMTCFLNDTHTTSLISAAMTDLYTLSNALTQYGVKKENKNKPNTITFLTLPFSHSSLSKNIYGIGIK